MKEAINYTRAIISASTRFLITPRRNERKTPMKNAPLPTTENEETDGRAGETVSLTAIISATHGPCTFLSRAIRVISVPAGSQTGTDSFSVCTRISARTATSRTKNPPLNVGGHLIDRLCHPGDE